MKQCAVMAVCAVALTVAAGCRSNQSTATASNGNQPQSLHEAVQETIDLVKLRDPSVAKWFDTAKGYAVFPGIGAGGFIIGGGYGTGEVYAAGTLIGTAKVTQLNIGATAGGQVTQEIIFFKDQIALDRFTSGGFEFDAAASAVAIKSGAAQSAAYNNGVAVFVMPKKGAMVQASLGTQRFTYTPN
jgi:lipid-binding SYLF domain-containing protein